MGHNEINLQDMTSPDLHTGLGLASWRTLGIHLNPLAHSLYSAHALSSSTGICLYIPSFTSYGTADSHLPPFCMRARQSACNIQ